MQAKPILAALLFAAACGGSSSSPVDGNVAGDGHLTDGAPGVDANPNAKPTIYTIVLENHDYAEIVSKVAGDAAATNAPYINGLINQYALATNYKDTIHPSLGNYLHMVSGENQYPGIVDLSPTTFPFPVDKQHLGTQLKAANVKWRAYQETMGTACNLNNNGKYAPKHNPFIYFKDMQSDAAYCQQVDVDYGQFAADMASNAYRFMWITPNLDSDGHDPSTNPVLGLKNSDAWMAREVPKILASDGYKAGGVLFITWDEAEGRGGDDKDLVPMIILSPRLKPGMKTSATAFTHSSYTATIEALLGLPTLPAVSGATTMMEFLTP
jgi:hypothetical protein